MILNLIWLIPAILFLISYLWEPRRLWNAYLLAGTLFNLAITLAGLTIVSFETWIGREFALTVFALFALMIPLSVLASTAYLIFNGRQMMSFEGHRLANMLSLLYGLGILVLLGLHFLPRIPLITPLLPVADFLLIYVTFLYLSYVFYGFWCNIFPVRKEPAYIIVLGSGLFGDKVPPLLAQRLDKGKQIFEKFQGRPQIIVSGGQGPDELVAEAQAMQAYLIEKGVPADNILMEDQSRTTFENLTFSKKLMTKDNPHTLVVTNSFHALRAGIYMKRIGLNGRSIGSRTALYFLPSAWIRETAGLVMMYRKWHTIFLGLLFLPWLLSLLLDLINLIIKSFQ